MFEKLKEKMKWLDPFTYVDLFILPKVKKLNESMQLIIFLISFLILSFLVLSVFGYTPVLLFSIFLLYVYLFFFEKEERVTLAIYILFAFIFAFILYYFILSFLLGTNSPLVIVFSGSMEPFLYRGDVVVLTAANTLIMKEAIVDFPIKDKLLSEYAMIGSRKNSLGVLRQASIKIGEKEFEFDEQGPIVVYYSDLQTRDIIHRAVLKIVAPDGDFVITLGDNNTRIDQDCRGAPSRFTCINSAPILEDYIKGKYLIHIPFIGQVKLLFFDDIPRLIFG